MAHGKQRQLRPYSNGAQRDSLRVLALLAQEHVIQLHRATCTHSRIANACDGHYGIHHVCLTCGQHLDMQHQPITN